MAMIIEWIRNNSTVLWGLSTASLVMFAGTLAALPFIVARIPEDYFVRKDKASSHHRIRHPVLRHIYLVVKNLLGIIFIVTGIIMLFLPGQGLLTIMIGVLLTNFPGKHKLVLKIIGQQKILQTINWMRAKSNKRPLQIPPKRS